jgi:hypothetical protein
MLVWFACNPFNALKCWQHPLMLYQKTDMIKGTTWFIGFGENATGGEGVLL